MTDGKKAGPLGPIVRKKRDATDEAAETTATESTPESVPTETKEVARFASASADGGHVARQPVRPKSVAVPKAASQADVSVSVDTNASTDDFAAMFAESGMGTAKRVRYSVGDQVEATVDSIGDRYVYFVLGGMNEGLAPIAIFRDADDALTVGVGDVVDLYVTDLRGGTIQLGQHLSTKNGAAEALEQASETGIPVEGRVESRNKGGYEIDIQGVRAFCPLSQIELAFTEDPDVHIGQSYRFRVTRFEEDGRNVVVSRSALQEEERAAAQENLKATLQEGMEVQGVVSRVADFGAFVDIGGLDGLVHISELGWSRVAHPSEVVKVGDNVTARILKIEDHKGELRIGLSLKQAQDDPWGAKISDYAEGQTVDGTVTRIEPFGAFVEIAPGLEGLVHISEMSWEKHVKRPEDVVQSGERISVEIQSIDTIRQRIGLSMKLSSGDPWANIDERFVVGAEVTGDVLNVEDFGAFVDLGGITALIPRSEMELSRDATVHQKFKTGYTVTARVLTIDKNRRRMALTMKSREQMAEAAEGPGPSSYQDTPKDNSQGGFGTFGDLLKSKLGGSDKS